MSNIDEKAKNNFTIEMRIFEKYEIIKVIDFLRHAETNLGMCRIFFYRMNARDLTSLASLCVVSWYALNVCVGRFLCSMFKAFLGNALKIGS